MYAYTVCPLYNVHCTLYNIHCIMYSVHCTLYSEHYLRYILKDVHHTSNVTNLARYFIHPDASGVVAHHWFGGGVVSSLGIGDTYVS